MKTKPIKEQLFQTNNGNITLNSELIRNTSNDTAGHITFNEFPISSGKMSFNDLTITDLNFFSGNPLKVSIPLTGDMNTEEG